MRPATQRNELGAIAVAYRGYFFAFTINALLALCLPHPTDHAEIDATKK